MSTTLNPEIAALREKVEEHGKELIASSLFLSCRFTFQ